MLPELFRFRGGDGRSLARSLLAFDSFVQVFLGSASPELLRQGSETLAGRIAIVEMGGFMLEELERPDLNRRWLRGGFPRSLLARSDAASAAWREDFIRTFLERDLAQLGVRVPAGMMRRFWTMLAHYSGGIWNSSGDRALPG